jgi:hypothetical protein
MRLSEIKRVVPARADDQKNKAGERPIRRGAMGKSPGSGIDVAAFAVLRFATALVSASAIEAPAAVAQPIVSQLRATAPSVRTCGVGLLPVGVNRIVVVGYRSFLAMNTEAWFSRFDRTEDLDGAPNPAG